MRNYSLRQAPEPDVEEEIKLIKLYSDTAAEPQPSSVLQISIKPASIVRVLATVVLVLSLLSVAGTFLKYFAGYDSVYGFVPNFNLDTEANVPTYFSSLLLLFSGLLFSVVAKYKYAVSDKYARQWLILGFIFFFLSLDEAAELHGLMMRPLESIADFEGIFYFSWVVPGMLLVAVCTLYFFRFYLSFDNRYKLRFLVAAVFYIGGVLGVELIGGYYADKYTVGNLTYEIITTVEEVLEMTGLVLVVKSLLYYIKDSISLTKVTCKP